MSVAKTAFLAALGAGAVWLIVRSQKPQSQDQPDNPCGGLSGDLLLGCLAWEKGLLKPVFETIRDNLLPTDCGDLKRTWRCKVKPGRTVNGLGTGSIVLSATDPPPLACKPGNAFSFGACAVLCDDVICCDGPGAHADCNKPRVSL